MMASDLVKEMEFVTAFRRNSKRMVPGAAFTRFVFLMLLVPTAVCGQQSFYMRDTEEYQELCKNHYSLSIPDENLTGSPLTLKESSGCVVMIDSPEPPARIRLYACVDLDGDGRQEAVLEHFTRGAHCCFDYRFFKLDQEALVPCGNLYLGNGNNPVFKDLDGDGKTEILTLDDSFAYFDGLCFACSPQLPLILCYRDGQFTDCTAGFSSLLSPLIEENLKGTAQDPTYERGMALEYLALHIIQGREKEGWAGVRRHYPNCFLWLKENAKSIHLHLDHRIYIREYLNP
jgi:hypothetical protein